MRQLLRHPLTPLCFFSFEASLCYICALVAGVSISPLMHAAVTNIAIVLLLMWIIGDAQRRHQVPCFDFGFLCWLFLPVSVPWYCLWSRGWKGLGILALIGILFLAPTIVSNATWQILYGPR